MSLRRSVVQASLALLIVAVVTLLAQFIPVTSLGPRESDADDHGAAGHQVTMRSAAPATAGPVIPPVLPPPPHPAPPPTPVRVDVGSLAGGRPAPPGFIGLSFEYSALPWYAGAPGALNPVLERLVRSLAPGQSPVLRVGGHSTDTTWWPVAHRRRPAGIGYTLTPAYLATVRALARNLDARVIAGVNLEAGRPDLAVAEAHALAAALGSHLAAVELGNEPHDYAHFPFYRHARRLVYGRARGYDFRRYLTEFTRVHRRLPGVPVAGPAVGVFSWLSHLPSFLSADSSQLAAVTFHRYPLNRCFTTPAAPNYPTIDHLLAPAASSGLVAGVARYAALAHRHHVAFRVDELGSVACGGKSGVSDTFASALWALDTLFELLHAGVDGVNLHTFPGAAYAPFHFHRHGGRWSATVRPEYLGLLMFARAVPPGAQLLRVSATHGSALKVWATRAPDGMVRVVLINKSPRQSLRTVVRVGRPAGPATLERLSAPSAAATDGAELAGQGFTNPSYTGALAGHEGLSTVSVTQGAYGLDVPPATATLLTFAR